MKDRTLSLLGTGGIPYRKELREYAGSVTGSLLMMQLDYWFSRHPDGFYKFLDPTPKHPDYREGDSWTEELGFSKAEFRTAFDVIGIRHLSKSAYAKAPDKFTGKDGEKFYASYHDKKNGLTWYFRNHTKVEELIAELCKAKPTKHRVKPFTVDKQPDFTVNQDIQSPVDKESESTVNVVSGFIEVKKVDLHKSTNLTYIDSESESTFYIQKLSSEINSETTHKSVESKISRSNTEDPTPESSTPQALTSLITKQGLSEKPVTSHEGNFSAAACREATQQSTKLFKEPFGQPRPKAKDIMWAWLPEGEWVVNGQLDPDFRDWVAASWVSKFNNTIHEARQNVVSHFRKQPEQLVLKWDEYSSQKLKKEPSIPLPDAVRSWQQVQHLQVWEQYNNCKDLKHFYSLRTWNRAYLEYALENLSNFDWSKHLSTVAV